MLDQKREPHGWSEGFIAMFGSRSMDDIHYYQDRAAECRRAAAEATDPSARVAHQQLVKFYEARIASALESAALRARPDPETA